MANPMSSFGADNNRRNRLWGLLGREREGEEDSRFEFCGLCVLLWGSEGFECASFGPRPHALETPRSTLDTFAVYQMNHDLLNATTRFQ